MKKLLNISMVSCFVFLSLFVYCQNKIFMTVEGTKQGVFKGEARANKNGIELMKVKMGAAQPSQNTGLSTGRRVHENAVIYKLTDASSNQFYRALTDKEVLKSVTIEFYKTTPNAGEQLVYTIILKNVLVSSFNHINSTSNSNTAKSFNKSEEEIKFLYQQIEEKFTGANKTSVDDWTK